MKRKMFLIIFILIIIILVLISSYIIFSKKDIINNKENISNSIQNITKDNIPINSIINATIIKVYEDTNQLLVSNCQNTSELIYVNYSNETNLNFKENQKIIIYYDGIINTTYPEQINNINKIEIIEENHNNENNVSVELSTFSIDKIILKVTDIKKIPSEYLINYELYKETKNINNTKKNYTKEATNTSTSSYSGSNLEYKYEKVNENSNINKADTIKRETINLLDTYTEEIEINLESIYNLPNGKYYIIFFCPNFSIRIDFNLNNDYLDYKEPYINNYIEPNTTYFKEKFIED